MRSGSSAAPAMDTSGATMLVGRGGASALPNLSNGAGSFGAGFASLFGGSDPAQPAQGLATRAAQTGQAGQAGGGGTPGPDSLGTLSGGPSSSTFGGWAGDGSSWAWPSSTTGSGYLVDPLALAGATTPYVANFQQQQGQRLVQQAS
ncbi:hypothetical protein HaLaN_16773, partial [Haematococcus lacustris]